MKVTTLACDYCTAVVAAIGTVRLQRGRKSSKRDPSLDLCKRHLRAIELVFARRSITEDGGRRGARKVEPGQAMARIEEHRTMDRERYQASKQGKPSRTQGGPGLRKGHELKAEEWVRRETVVLSLIPASGQITTRDLWDQVCGLAPQQRLKRSRVHETIARLKKKGFVKQVGTRTHTRYERANGKAG